MKVLLVNTDFRYNSDVKVKVQPLTMYTIAGIISPFVEEVKVIEPMKYRLQNSKDEFLSVLISEAQNVDLIAFTVNSFSWAEISKVSKEIKQNAKDIKIVVGGIHVSYFYKEILIKNPQIDFALVGEAEKSFPKLIQYLKGEIEIEQVPNLKYQKHGQVISNKAATLVDFKKEKIPMPRYDLLENKFFDRLTFEASRGCEGNCSFCSVLHKRCWRCYDERDVLNRLDIFKKYLDERCKSKDFIFTDDCFTTDQSWAGKVLKGMMELGFQSYNILIEARAKNLWDESLLEVISGYDNLHIQIGIESGYDEGLSMINKEIRVSDILKTVSLLDKYGICKNVFTSFIIGFPWETKKECMETIKFAAFLNDQYGIEVNVAWWMPLPSNLFFKYTGNTDIFNNELFSTDSELFYCTHPKISVDDVSSIGICDFLYKNLGINWRL
ncbi:radical SAM protein [Clostridium sp. BNL1100]|uniref:B12-binding domain-containing radical SAM protein n=1 Tax=Clostridium sp. BNL1100 TaxID=755731 RepID=UPI00024A71B9|nr:radical SAM protein [Clostridium sp. BNL1100]AEY67201.1 Fe-S oxidoreductase [Clostridium sp. BNL1100]